MRRRLRLAAPREPDSWSERITEFDEVAALERFGERFSDTEWQPVAATAPAVRGAIHELVPGEGARQLGRREPREPQELGAVESERCQRRGKRFVDGAHEQRGRTATADLGDHLEAVGVDVFDVV